MVAWELRADVKAGVFTPLPVRGRVIPKSGGSLRRRMIPTVRDRMVRAALKLMLEPIVEARFRPCSYGFRPQLGTHDAIAEILTNSGRTATSEAYTVERLVVEVGQRGVQFT